MNTGKIEENNFLLLNNQFFNKLKFSGNLYFSHNKRLSLAKVQKELSQQRNEYSQELLYK